MSKGAAAAVGSSLVLRPKTRRFLPSAARMSPPRQPPQPMHRGLWPAESRGRVIRLRGGPIRQSPELVRVPELASGARSRARARAPSSTRIPSSIRMAPPASGSVAPLDELQLHAEAVHRSSMRCHAGSHVRALLVPSIQITRRRAGTENHGNSTSGAQACAKVRSRMRWIIVSSARRGPGRRWPRALPRPRAPPSASAAPAPTAAPGAFGHGRRSRQRVRALRASRTRGSPRRR